MWGLVAEKANKALLVPNVDPAHTSLTKLTATLKGVIKLPETDFQSVITTISQIGVIFVDCVGQDP